MKLLVTYLGLAVIGIAGTYAICRAVELVLPAASLPVFLVLFFSVLCVAWVIAVWLTEPKGGPAASA